MTDTLRTRIIAAIAKADQDWCSDNPLHEDMADAVIRELDLGIPCVTTGCRMRQIARRHSEASSRLEQPDDSSINAESVQESENR